MRHLPLIVFLTVAAGGAAGAWALLSQDEPLGSGEVGELTVYGQIPFGPVPLLPNESRRLPRPQDFAFELNSAGHGPRYVRIELEAKGLSSVVFEDRFGAPAEKESLEFVLRVGDDYPDDIELVTTIEAPHAASVVERYPIVLVGPERPFWEKE